MEVVAWTTLHEALLPGVLIPGENLAWKIHVEAAGVAQAFEMT
jgi:hypothetical protein